MRDADPGPVRMPKGVVVGSENCHVPSHSSLFGFWGTGVKIDGLFDRRREYEYLLIIISSPM